MTREEELMKKTKSIVITIVIIVYLLGILPRQAVYAEEVTPPPEEQTTEDQSQSTDSSNPGDQGSDPQTQTSQDPTDQGSDPEITSSASPSPSPSPDPCVSDCPPTEVDQTNDASIDNQVTDTANTGDSTISANSTSDESEPTSEVTGGESDPTEEAIGPEGSDPHSDTGSESSNDPVSSAIDTGDAASEVDIVNLANTNLVNSTVNYTILNIYLDEDGNIDLTKSEALEFESSANLVVNQQNTATVNNTVLAVANTGENSIDGTAGTITTGSASIIVNIINFINANLINANWNFVLINIFGNLVGNIILPEPPPAGGSGADGGLLLSANQTNDADIQNDVAASANTGNNGIDGSGSIQTGDAFSFVNLQTYANSNLIGGNYNYLLINNFGIWNGTFYGWGAAGAATPTYGQMLFSFLSPNSSNQDGSVLANQQNYALLTNSVTAQANTGGNSLTGSGGINTGNAFSVVNILNFVNTNIINSFGFFGIINIFGTLNGDIGGADHFPMTTESQSQSQSEESSQSQEEVRVAGGQLEASMTTNVGTHVNPGDTVMFFINAKNPGTGPVYDSKVVFNLYDSNGEIGAIQTFDIGKLEPGQTAKISFGLVLAGTAPSGLYGAIVEANGKVGPDDTAIASQSETTFRVGLAGGLLSGIVPEVQAAETVGGIGATPLTAESNPIGSLWWRVYMALGVIGMVYVLYRLSRPTYRFILAPRRRKFASKLASRAMAFRSWFFEL